MHVRSRRLSPGALLCSRDVCSASASLLPSPVKPEQSPSFGPPIRSTGACIPKQQLALQMAFPSEEALADDQLAELMADLAPEHEDMSSWDAAPEVQPAPPHGVRCSEQDADAVWASKVTRQVGCDVDEPCHMDAAASDSSGDAAAAAAAGHTWQQPQAASAAAFMLAPYEMPQAGPGAMPWAAGYGWPMASAWGTAPCWPSQWPCASLGVAPLAEEQPADGGQAVARGDSSYVPAAEAAGPTKAGTRPFKLRIRSSSRTPSSGRTSPSHPADVVVPRALRSGSLRRRQHSKAGANSACPRSASSSPEAHAPRKEKSGATVQGSAGSVSRCPDATQICADVCPCSPAEASDTVTETGASGGDAQEASDLRRPEPTSANPDAASHLRSPEVAKGAAAPLERALTSAERAADLEEQVKLLAAAAAAPDHSDQTADDADDQPVVSNPLKRVRPSLKGWAVSRQRPEPQPSGKGWAVSRNATEPQPSVKGWKAVGRKVTEQPPEEPANMTFKRSLTALARSASSQPPAVSSGAGVLSRQASSQWPAQGQDVHDRDAAVPPPLHRAANRWECPADARATAAPAPAREHWGAIGEDIADKPARLTGASASHSRPSAPPAAWRPPRGCQPLPPVRVPTARLPPGPATAASRPPGPCRSAGFAVPCPAPAGPAAQAECGRVQGKLRDPRLGGGGHRVPAPSAPPPAPHPSSGQKSAMAGQPPGGFAAMPGHPCMRPAVLVLQPNGAYAPLSASAGVVVAGMLSTSNLQAQHISFAATSRTDGERLPASLVALCTHASVPAVQAT